MGIPKKKVKTKKLHKFVEKALNDKPSQVSCDDFYKL